MTKERETRMGNRPEAARDLMADSAIHEDWVSTYRTAEAQAFYEMAFDEIARRLGAPPDATVLDAGCGSCAKSILLAKRGFRVVGTDYAQSALDLAAQTLKTNGLSDRITLRREDLTTLSFPDGQFKYIVCWGVLMHVPEVQRALAELARVLAPGGVLVISEGNMYSAQSIALRTLKRLLGRGRGRVVRRPSGIESIEEMESGTLLTRQADIAWYISELQRNGLRLRARVPGQFSELYALVPGRVLKLAIHAINSVWFNHIRLAGPAFGNIIFMEKAR